jgi:tetratricopeptide (TPR) repeat protein
VWTAKGHALLALNKDAEAARSYEKALGLQPDYVPAVNALAAYYLDTGKPEKAFALVDRAVTSGNGDANTYLLRGQILLRQGRGDAAAADFESALRGNPHPEETLKEEADSYVALGRLEDGKRLYLEGIRRYPSYAPNHLAMGSYYLKERQPAEALPYFKAALAMDLDPSTRQKVQRLVGQLESAAGGTGK